LSWSFDAVAKDFLLAAYFSSTDYASKNPDIVSRFARGIREASAYTNSHRAQTVDLIAKFTSISPQTIAHMTRVTCAETLEPREIQPQIDLCVKFKLIDAPFDARELVATAVK
jgi:ABC-type nitrate/sulfonate/bicarbonate transport system substrate-binding protein